MTEINDRLQVLEEKFEYQERTIDALNEVIIEQQAQINAIEDQIRRLKALISASEDKPGRWKKNRHHPITKKQGGKSWRKRP